MAIRKTTPGGGLASLNIIGSIDCSTNPDYPKADAGDIYIVSHSGHIGGDPAPSADDGQPVTAGDFIVCEVDGTASGTHAAVGANWTIIQASTSINYTNLTPTLAALGGVGIGETFTNQTMKQMWDKLLYPYIAPEITLVTLNPAAGYKKIGDSIVAPTITPTVNVNSNPITHLSVTAVGGSIYTDTRVPPPAIVDGVQAAWTDPATITATTTYTVHVDDAPTGGGTDDVTATYTFIYPYYYGSHADGAVEGDILAMTEVVSPPTDNLTLTFSPNAERVYFAVPPGSTAYTKVYDQNLFDVTADFLPSTTMTVNGQTYVIYEIDHDIGDGSAITFKFVF